MILIIGASGFIGNSIYKYFKFKRHDVQGTYFKNKIKDLIYFDISKNNIEELKFNKKLKYIIISSAININLDEAKKNWQNSYYINVERVKIIIDYCYKNKIIPIYISSDAVFDGVKGNYCENDRKNPILSYGRIKNEVENYLLNSNKDFLIVRTGRVFGIDQNDGTLLTKMKKNLLNNKKIKCSNDQIFSTLYVGDLSINLEKLIENNCKGIFHLISIKSTTHLEIAKEIKKFFNIKGVEILPSSINSFDIVEKRPLLINLLGNKFEKLFNIKYNNLKYYLEKIYKNEKKNN